MKTVLAAGPSTAVRAIRVYSRSFAVKIHLIPTMKIVFAAGPARPPGERFASIRG
jgi:hypothetical protein